MATNNKDIKLKSPTALNWFKNVGRSLGYTSTELVQSMAPSTIEFAVSNTQAVRDLISEMRTMKSSGKKLADSLGMRDHMDIANTAIKNAIEDLKSGKFYNKERQDSIYDEGLEDFELSDDFDFGGDGDFDVDIKSSTDESGKTTNLIRIDSNINKNNPMVKAVERQTQAMMESDKAAGALQISLAANKMAIDKKIGAGIMQGLDAINNNLSLLVNFQSESMTKYIGASLKFYEDNLKVLNDTLEEIRKTTSQEAVSNRKAYEDPLDLAFLSRGGLNLKGYAQLIKKQFNNAVDSNMFLSPIKLMLQDKDTLKFLAASPLSFISTRIVSTLIPAMLRKSLEDMDKSFSNFFPAMLMKINRLSLRTENPILSLLGQIFGISTKTKTSSDLSLYNKGPVPFDGYTKQAIVQTIPTYLRKILAAISGKDEMAYDYETGQFKSVGSMKQEFEESRDRQILNVFSDTIDEIKDRVNAINISNTEERKEFLESIDKFFLNLSKTTNLVNPRKTKDKQGNIVDDLAGVYNFKTPQQLELFRRLVLSLDNNLQMKMFGSDVLNARKIRERIYAEAEENQMKNNMANIFAWDPSEIDKHLIKEKDGKTIGVKRDWSPIFGADKFGSTPADYLRDIKKILMKGIVVFPSNNSEDVTKSTSSRNIYANAIKKMEEAEIREREKRIKRNEIKPLTSEEIIRNTALGRISVESFDDLNIEGDGLNDIIQTYVQERDRLPKQDQEDNIAKWFGRFFKGNTRDKYEMIRQKTSEWLAKPAEILSDAFKYIDNTLYKIVFGEGENENASFMVKVMAGMKAKFEQFGKWMNEKVFKPVEETLFGKDGLMTKLKNSEFTKNLKGKLSQFAEYMFGKKDGEGKLKGGLISDTANSMLDMWDNAKYFFTGKAYTNRAGQSFPDNEVSVFGQMKGMFTSFKTTMKEYLFGRKPEKEGDAGEKGVLAGAVTSLKQGFQNFSELIFGPKKIGSQDNKNYIAIDEMTKKIKERAPKAIATGIIGSGAGLLLGGKLGLLGSIFLPGGPIGGAIVGTTLGFVSQSDRFKDWLFGPMAKNEKGEMERVGGFINKKTQDFLKQNKAGIIGGATVGAAKSVLGIGLLPSFLLPGGPIGGAITGMGISMVTRSNKFQNFMFGPENEDGKRSGGVIDKIFGSFRKDKNGKNVFGNMAAGTIGGATLGLVTSKFGLMGAMLLPGGPIGGALLGAATGIAISSDKWRKALFGEFDEDTQLRKGGIFGKFINWTKLEIFQPLKLKFEEINLNIQEWFAKSIANPFKNALEPIKYEIKVVIKSMKEAMAEGWKQFTGFLGNTFERFVGMPFGKFMEDKVMKPLRSFFSKVLSITGKIVGSVISAPFRGLEGVSRGLTKKHMEKGLEDYVAESWAGITDFRGRRERGERMGLFRTVDKDGNVVGKGFFGRFGDIYFNKDARQQARYKGAPYAAELEADIKRRKDETDAEFSRRRRELNAKKAAYQRRKAIGMGAGYDNFTYDEDGNIIDNVSSVYKTHENDGKRSPRNQFESSTEKIKNKTGVGSSDSQVYDDSYLSSTNKKSQKDSDTETNIQPSDKVRRKKSKSDTRDSDYSSTTSSSSSGASVAVKPSSRSKSTNQSSIKIKPEIINQIAADVRVIAQEVKGQLDGVGSNVYKIRKITQKQAGLSDSDISGSANRDRMGFFGKLRRGLANPIDWVKEQLTKPVKWISEGLSTVGNKLKTFGNFLISIPRKVVNTAKSIGKELWGVTREVTVSLLTLPKQLLKIIGSLVEGAVETIKAIGPAIGESLKGVAKLFSGAMGMAANAAIGFGKGLGEFLFEFGKGMGQLFGGIAGAVGEAVKGFSSALFKAVPMVTGFLFDTTKAIADFTFSTVKTVGEKLLDVGNTLFQIVTSPLKWAAGALGKVAGIHKTEVIVSGGTIDKVKEIDVIHIIDGKIPDGISSNQLKTEPTEVRIVGSTESIPVYLSSEKILESFRHIFPVPVTIQTKQTQTDATPQNRGIFDRNGNPIITTPPGTETIKNAMVSALRIEDAIDEKEDDMQAEQAKKENEIEAAKAFTTRKTQTFLEAENAAKEEKKRERDWKSSVLGSLQSIKESTKNHFFNWSSIFGNKGLVTAAIIAALPFVKKLFDWFILGKGNDNRMDVGGTTIVNTDAAETAVRAVAKTTGHFASKIPFLSKYVGPVKGIQASKKFFSEGIDDLRSVFKESIEGSLDNVVKEAGEKSGSETVQAVQNKTLKKFIELAKSAVDNIVNIFTKKYPKAANAIGAIKSKVVKVLKLDKLAKHLPKISSGMAKIGASTATLFLSDAPFAIWGAITGLFEADHLFQVRNYQVDEKMRIISSGMKALLNVSWFFVIDILNDLCTELIGLDFLQIVASEIYKAISDDEDDIKLEQAQAEFKADWEAYNEEQKALDPNFQGISLDAYNDKVNRTVGAKIGDVVSGAKNMVKKGASAVANGFKFVGNKIGETLSKGGKALWNYSDIGNFADSRLVKQNLGLDPDSELTVTIGQRVSSYLGQSLEQLTFGLVKSERVSKSIYGAGLKIGDLASGVLEKAKEIGTEIWDGAKWLGKKSWGGITWAGGKIVDDAKWLGNFAVEHTPALGIINAAYGAISNDQVRENLGIPSDVDVEITFGDRLASALANGVESLTFGLVKSESIGGKIHDFGVRAKDFAGNVLDGAKDIANKLWEGAKWLGQKAWSGIKGFTDKYIAPEIDRQLTTNPTLAIFNAMRGAFNDDKVREALGLGEDAEIKIFDRVKSFGAHALETLSFGLLKADKIASFVTNIGKTVSSFFTNLFDSAKKLVDSLIDDDLSNNTLEKRADQELQKQIDAYNKKLSNARKQTGIIQGYSGEGGGFGTGPEKINNFAYYSQADDRWSNVKYDHSPSVGIKASNPTIKERGCGPTSMAMVLTQLTGQKYEPPQLAQMAERGGYSTQAGTSWSYFDAVARDFNLAMSKVDPQKSPATIPNWLNSGLPVIISGKRTSGSISDSPFTSAGHFVVATGMDGANRIKINDPRGAQYSKSYNLNTVLNQSRQAWAFNYRGGSIPAPVSSSSFSTINSSDGSYSILDLFSKMAENFSIYSDNIFGGTTNTLTWGSDDIPGGSVVSTSSGPINIDFIPKTIQDRILKKATEETIEHESGGKYTIARNDLNATTGKQISPSIGILQWRGGNAKTIMQKMYSLLPNDPDAKYYATQVNWQDSSPWSKAQQERLQAFLTRNYNVTKKVQDEMALNYVNNTNLSQVYKHGVSTGKIKDPRSIVFMTDIANTGPGLVDDFFNVYTPTSSTGKAEFEHFYREFLNKSYWGKRRNIYGGRLTDLYNDLIGWDPEQGGYGEMIANINRVIDPKGCEGGLGELTSNLNNKVNAMFTNDGKLKAEGIDFSTLREKSPELTSYINGASQSEGISDQILRQVLTVLHEIADNTGTTSEGINELVKKDTKVEIITNNPSSQTDSAQQNNQTSNVIITPQSQNNYINPMIDIATERRNNKQQKEYTIAKTIAKGRIN